MFPNKYFNQEKDDLISTVFSELKILGVKLPKLKKFKSVYTKQEKISEETSCKIFGVSLSAQEWIVEGESLLPKFVALSTTYLLKFSCSEVGLFRKAGNIARQKKLRVRLENGECLEDCEPNDVASLLKQWLRELPEPLIPAHLQDLFVRCLQLVGENNQITACLLTSLLFLPAQLNILRHLFCFMAHIASNCDTNKMSTFNLALIMAPNIFAITEPSDKTKNNLLQQCTSVLKLLIENCDYIGEIPPGITFQYPPLSSELDSSCDILDTNKSKKKRKSGGGHVQDIFSGFKKLVSQNGTPSKMSTPENNLDAPKSATKRKGDPDHNILNKKQALSAKDLNNVVHTVTPKLKGVLNSSAEKTTHGHVRRKSIGALLRRKRGKSNKSGDMQRKVQPNNSFESKEITIKIPNAKLNFDEMHNSKKNCLSTQAGSIKKSLSDRRLLEAVADFSVFPTLTVSTSQGNLPIRPLQSSPYHLRSKLNKSWMGEGVFLEDLEKKVDAKTQLKNTNLATTFDKEINIKTDISPNNFTTNIISVKSDLKNSAVTVENNYMSSKNLRNERAESQKSVSPKISLSKENFNVPEKSMLKKASGCPADSELPKNSKTSDKIGLEMQKSGMVRQEAFIRKSTKKKSVNPNAQVKRSASRSELDSKNRLPKKQGSNSNLRKSVEQQRLNRRNGLERRSLRKKTRHGSLIRGKPNSVNSGLPTALPRNCSNDSALAVNSPSYSRAAHESFLKFCETSILESPQIPSLDLSLNILLQNFTLASPTDPSQLSLNIGISSSNNSTINFNTSQKDVKPKHSLVKVPAEVHLSSLESDTQNQDPGSYCNSQTKSNSKFDLTDKDNTSPQKFNSGESSFALTDIPCERLQTPTNFETIPFQNDNQNGQIFDDSCFKTPKNLGASLESVNWMSGSSFFSSLPSPQEDVGNKRESIAMILKNNTGHVQAKVNLYDKHVQSSDSFGALKENSNPYKTFSKSSQKCFSADRRTKQSQNYESIRKCSSVKGKNRIPKSPLPPPPKFSLTDINTPSPKGSRPLQELTNISLELEESKLERSSSFKYPEHESPLKNINNPVELKNNSSYLKAKVKRNSFSGCTPYKLSKRVSRSESSPACHRKNTIFNE